MNRQAALLDRLELSSPWMNATGFLGYFPPPRSNWVKPMGAFVTNPVSLLPRKPAFHRLVQPFPGGFLLHTGFPNPGIHTVLQQYAEKWAKIPVPVWVNVLAQTPDELLQIIKPLEDLENIGAIELGIPPGISLKLILDLIRAASGEIPLMVCLGVDQIQTEWIESIHEAGASGVVLSAPKGMLIVENHIAGGRLYGPAVFPQMLKTVCRMAQFDLPVIAGGGIFSEADGEALLEAGAAAVQLDAVLWRNWEV
jgi:dihydroorotate dehydrogenase (NAD+) catalytic subunit